VDITHGYITDAIDLSTITLCKSVTKVSGEGAVCKAYDSAATWDGACTYKNTGELRYILLY
jgi:hypothetical protein